MTLRVGNIPQLAGVPYKALDALSFLSYQENLPDRNFQKLTSGELDAALISVVDLVVSPDLLSLDFGMGCRARSDSMLIYARHPLETLHTVHVYGCSRSSQLLLQLLFQDCFGFVPHTVRHAEFEPLDCIARHEGALCLHELPGMQRAAYPVRRDLASWWHERTGRPFVFLVWALRRDCLRHGELPRLRTWLARAAHISDALAHDFASGYGVSRRESLTFVGANRRYRLDEFLMSGLREFLRCSRKLKLLPPVGFHAATQPVLRAPSFKTGAAP